MTDNEHDEDPDRDIWVHLWADDSRHLTPVCLWIAALAVGGWLLTQLILSMP